MRHYYVPNTEIPSEAEEAARSAPPDSVFEELRSFSIIIDPDFQNEEELVSAAEKILQGTIDVPLILEVPGNRSLALQRVSNVSVLLQDSSNQQWLLPALIVPNVLLKAYRVSGRNEFLLAARDDILAWASYERSVWLPRGLLWNDHVIAERIRILAEFWGLYRRHPQYESVVAREILQLVVRSARFLAKPSHFTFATNHGVMQNLALWHLSVAFPTLPDIGEYKEVALHRLNEQMGFYVNTEGVVLEHSAGYHKSGLENLQMTFRYLSLLNLPVPEEWRRKYDRAERFYAQLRRPDGSLPAFGNTGITDRGYRVLKGDSARAPAESYSVYPVAGYSIWWDGLDKWPDPEELAQTVAVWSYFPGHGHKHADDLSVLLWAGGHAWWTNVGYWPYGVPGEAEAYSWQGSNAPHLVGEKSDSSRTTRLVFYGNSERIAAIDLERIGPGGYRVRRQLVHWKPDLWMIIDSTSGDAQSRTTTAWTSSPKTQIREGRIPGSYEVLAGNSPVVLTKFILGSDGMQIHRFHGSSSPFAGWVVVDGVPRPVPTIVTEQPANESWAVAIWKVGKAQDSSAGFAERPEMKRWGNAESWELSVPMQSGPLVLRRDSSQIVMEPSSDKASSQLELTRAASVEDEIARIHSAYQSMEEEYPRFRPFVDSRWKVTYALLFAFFFQEALVALVKRLKAAYYPFLRILALCGWVGVGGWLVLVYYNR